MNLNRTLQGYKAQETFGAQTQYFTMTRDKHCNSWIRRMRAWLQTDLLSSSSKTGTRSGKAWISTGSSSTSISVPMRRKRTNQLDTRRTSISSSSSRTRQDRIKEEWPRIFQTSNPKPSQVVCRDRLKSSLVSKEILSHQLEAQEATVTI